MRTTSEGLLRAVRRWDLVALMINTVIGAGIFGLPAAAHARIGVYSLAAFLVCGLAAALIVLCFAEVSSRFVGTGGPYLYARTAFGPAVGFQVGWTMWIARVTAFAANCNLMVAYVGYFWEGADEGLVRIGLIVATTVALSAVNLVGVRESSVATDVLTVVKLLPLVIFVAVGLAHIEPARFDWGPLPEASEFSVAVLLLLYAFTGFEMSVIPGGELRNPGRDAPYALLLGIGVIIAFYILIQVTAVGVLDDLGASDRPLSDAAGVFLGPWGAALISAGAVVSILANLNVVMLVSPRLPFAAAERGEAPRFLAETHPRFHTPAPAILFTAGVMLALTLSGTFVYAATVSVIARLFGYVAVCAALPALRRRADVPPAVYRAPFGSAAAVVSLGLIAWLLAHTTVEQALGAGAAVAAGFGLYGLSRRG